MRSRSVRGSELASPVDSAEAIPTWFGDTREPLFGVVHLPVDRKVRGGVVLCPPIGDAQTGAHAALRAAATQLARQGIAVMRFDYYATGDSAGYVSDADAVPQWLDSIVAAADYLRALGVDSVAFAGLGLGALLAAAAAPRVAPIEGLLAWDPVLSGRRYLRSEEALYRLVALRSEAGAEREAVGINFSVATVESLSALTFDAPAVTGAHARRPAGGAAVAVLPAPRQYDDPQVRKLETDPDVAILRPDVDAAERSLDMDFFYGRLPAAAIGAAVAWFDTRFTPTAVAIEQIEVRHRADVCSSDGRLVREELVEIPGGMFGIRTEPLLDARTDVSPVLIPTVAVAPRSAYGRCWVDLSRRLAAEGVTALRFDRRGVGDSINDALGYLPRVHTAESAEDVISAARFISPADPGRVRIVGLCSAAWMAARASLTLHPDEIILINPARWQTSPMSDAESRTILPANMGPSVEPVGNRRERASRWAKDTVRERSPYAVWSILGRLGMANMPAQGLPLIAANARQVRLVFGGWDAQQFAEQRGDETLSKLSGRTRVETLVYEDADHGLVTRAGREHITDDLVRILAAAPDRAARERLPVAATPRRT